ncbi:hypothetical protein KKC94_03520 [Patescibacteria group bacterium]|nr:hypothetical protein [Patescibacteria group bacterium]
MKYRAIIRESWALTQENKRLIWWFAVAPAILSTLVSGLYLAYQVFAFWSSPVVRKAAENTDSAFSLIAKKLIAFVTENPGVGVFAIVIIAIVGLFYLMLPVFTQGALIELIARIRKGQQVSMADGVSYGMTSFLQLFEYHLMIKTFSWVSIVTEAFFIFRSFGLQSFLVFGWIFVIFLVVALILTLLFTFTEYYIVLAKKPVFKSILLSSGLVIRQWHHILFMLLLMAIITIRIVINLLVALLIPFLIIAPIVLFASFTLAILGVIVGAIIGLVALYFTSYFVGIFHVFAMGVWTFTFLELTAKEAADSHNIPDPEES